MRVVETFSWGAILATLGLAAAAGCKKEDQGPPPRQAARKTQVSERKEVAMGVTLKWFGHATFRISHAATTVYIDPWKLQAATHDATLVLISHSHYDHYSAEDVAKVSGPNTELVASADVVAKQHKGLAIKPGQSIVAAGVRVTGVAAYNPAKKYHPRSNDWLGFVIELGGRRIYYAGDTDVTAEMKALKDLDVALLPVGGTYTMDATEAAEAIKQMRPMQTVPYHWGDIIGSRDDADRLARAAPLPVMVIEPGKTANF